MSEADTDLRIVLAEDHAVVREGLRLLLDLVPGWKVVGEAGDAVAVLASLRECAADLIVLDLGMPGVAGLSFIGELRAAYPGLRILVLTANVDTRTLRAALEAGADGYLAKHDEAGEVREAVRAVVAGETYVGRSLRAAVPGPAGGAATVPANAALSPIPLTEREWQILRGIADGDGHQQIGARLRISPLTVRKHRENLMRKLDLHSTAELTAFAVRIGLGGG
ncbi:response regulator transcription factor [Dokdonella sp.]|uniref:response regulator n=1 Tax=Dokdonella sp. TaxID=2291710 RepID=UPI001B1516E2|nr:response regulator transcription factor [Dokdonella sp.]MBO9662540.1 response regulator transcription factor [Dokdonella sp.]